MKALKYKATFAPKPGVKKTRKEISEKRSHIDSDKVFKDPKIELIDAPKPKITRPDDVLIKIKACGICGTDIHLLETDEDGYMLYPGHMKGDMILGHEFCGIVEEVGPEVTDLKPGDKVIVEEMQWCGSCLNCKNGFPNQCMRLEEFGITLDGGMAEYVVSSEKWCWNINGFDNVYKDEKKVWYAGCQCEPSSVAYNALFECGPGFRPGAYVVVFGCGPVGSFAVAHCKNQGAAKIIVFEPIKERVALAKEMGADYIFDPLNLEDGKTVEDVILELTDGLGADFYVEASGVAEVTFGQIERTMAAGARVISTAMGKEKVPLYFVPFANKKGNISFNIGHSGYGNFMYVIRLISSGRYDPSKAVTAEYKIEDYETAFEDARTRLGGKVVLMMN